MPPLLLELPPLLKTVMPLELAELPLPYSLVVLDEMECEVSTEMRGGGMGLMPPLKEYLK